MTIETDSNTVLPRRRLTQRGAAVALGLGLIAIPGVPALVDEVLPPREWGSVTLDETVAVTTVAGVTVTAEPPRGWDVLDMGNSAVLVNGDAQVTIAAVDLEDRDPDLVVQRLIRQAKMGGFHATLDGGTASSADGAFAGTTCVVVTADTTGTCAYVSDGSVLISVVSLAAPGTPALPAGDIAESLVREEA